MADVMEIRMQLFGVIKRQGEWYFAHCPPLDIATQGRTEAEAKRNLQEASEFFVISCLERGTFDEAMKQLGWSVAKQARPRNTFPLPVAIPIRFSNRAACPA